MKTINKILSGLCVLAVMASCSDSNDSYSAGSWNAAAGYAKVAFQETSISDEIAPTDPCEKVIILTRANTDGELTVPITIVSNTDDIFTLSPVTFADGEAEAELRITFDGAEVGKTYSLEIAVEGEQYVSFYSADVRMNYSVIRVKWNPAGFYYDEETGEKVEGWAKYTDDLVGVWYPVGNPTYYVPVEERDDMPGYYRVVNAYDQYYPYNEDGDYDPDVDSYFYIDATNPKQVIIRDRSNQTADWGSGAFIVWSKAGYMLASGSSMDDVEEFLGTYKNGKITFPAGSLIFGEADYGMTFSNNNAAFCLVINPDLDPYNADIASDFDWEEYAPEAEFTSNLYDGYKQTVALYKGTCNKTTDDCDKRFAEEYGTAYRIESPYQDGTDLYFCVNEKGQIVVPEGYEKQFTGMYSLNTPVYAAITAESTYEEKVITLNISFTDKKDTMDYGNANEIFTLWEYNPVGIASYTYTILFTDYDEETDEEYPVTDEDLELLEREDGGIFRVSGYGYGIDLMFEWDREANTVNVPEQVVATHPNYGDVYVAERDYYQDEDDEELTHSTFDPETNTFHFGLAYYVGAGCFGFGVEDMEVEFTSDEAGESLVKKSSAARAAKLQPFTQFSKSLKHKAKAGHAVPKIKKPLKGTPVSKRSIKQARQASATLHF